MKTKLTYRTLARMVLLIPILNSQLSTCHAQGTAFTYQGRLDTTNGPANGIYDLRFTIYDAASGGAVVAGPVTNSPMTISNGLFTVSLDFGAGVFDGSSRWLEVAVRTNSGGAFALLAPRQAVTATPYALTAGLLSGTLPSANLAGTYSNVINLTNVGNNFAGNGAGLTQLNATQLKSGTVDDVRLPASIARTNQVWLLGGNFGTAAGTHYLGTADNQPVEIRINGSRVLRLEDNGDGSDSNFLPDGAPNLIGGSPLNTVSPGVVGATISGGGATNQNGAAYPNLIASDYGAIGGGFGHHIAVRAIGGVIAGGFINSIRSNAAYSAILGGQNNIISTNTVYGTVGGGWLNELGVKADFAVIGGGWLNDIADNARWGVIGGGLQNNIGPAAEYNTVSGGQDNVIAAGASHAVIPGGRNNTVNTNASHAFAAGLRAKANHRGAFVWADATESDFASTGNNQFNVRAGGGARFVTGGAGMTVDGVNVFVGSNGAGLTNLNAAQLSSGTVADVRLSSNVALRNQNNAFSVSQSIRAGTTTGPGLAFNGDANTGLFSPAANTIAVTTGGAERFRVTATGLLGLGTNTPAARLHIASAGSMPQLHLGQNDSANAFTRIRFSVGDTNLWDLAAGGTANVMNFFNSGNGNVMVLSTNGHLRVNALGVGTDSTAAHFTVAGDSSQPQLRLQQTTGGATPRLRMINGNSPYWDMFTAANGDFIRWYSERTGFNAMTLEDDGTLTTAGPVNPPSDRNVKQDFAAVDAQSVLEKVAALPIQSWAYKNSPETRHLGPVAQDFHAAFQLNGDDDKHISTVDADGVALAAIQGLNAKVETRTRQLEAENAVLRNRLEQLEELLTELNRNAP